MDSTKSKRQEQLEALRQRRTKTKLRSEDLLSSSVDPESNVQNNNGNSSVRELENDDDESPHGSEPEPYGGNELSGTEDLDQYEEDFVDHDEEGALGVPADLNDIPFEFTRHRYKRLKDHFKDVVEWMVHNKLNPAFPRDDPVYRAAFSKVNDEVMGLTGSQLVSSAWNIDFKRALEARPGIEVTSYPTINHHPCDACNRSGHPASFDIRFDGEPYLLETLEAVSESDESNSEDSDNDDNERGNIDREGNEIPGSETHFYLGR